MHIAFADTRLDRVCMTRNSSVEEATLFLKSQENGANNLIFVDLNSTFFKDTFSSSPGTELTKNNITMFKQIADWKQKGAQIYFVLKGSEKKRLEYKAKLKAMGYDREMGGDKEEQGIPLWIFEKTMTTPELLVKYQTSNHKVSNQITNVLHIQKIDNAFSQTPFESQSSASDDNALSSDRDDTSSQDPFETLSSTSEDNEHSFDGDDISDDLGSNKSATYIDHLKEKNVEAIQNIIKNNPNYDFFAEVPDPEYKWTPLSPYGRQIIRPTEWIFRSDKITKLLKEHVKSQNIIIVQDADDLNDINHETKAVYCAPYAAVNQLDLSNAVNLEILYLDNHAKIKRLI
ncbi:MAG: hypothetical protein Q8K36_02015, partial [Alphaproteobacteria bacterium]|nr:hypothetical protein [Alphaproteobacteria bacterium]